MDFSLGENRENEVLTQIFSAREAARHIASSAPEIGHGINGPLATYFMNLTTGVNLGTGRDIFGTVASLNDTDLTEAAYQYVMGPHTYKTPEQEQAQRSALAIRREAKAAVMDAFNRDNSLREVDLRRIFVEEVDRLSEEQGVDAMVIQRDTSFASGYNTSVIDYQPRGFGRRLNRGNFAILDAVVDVDGQRADESDNFVVIRVENGNLELREVDYDLGREEFAQSLRDLGLNRAQRRMHTLGYDAYHRTLAGLMMGADDYASLGKLPKLAMKQRRLGRRFGYWNSIHELFGDEGQHGFAFGHFDDRMPLEGMIRAGDVINIEPFISIPGGEAIRKKSKYRSRIIYHSCH